jgi:2'-5' RNA ligase
MSKRLFLGLELPETFRQDLAALDPHIKGVRWLNTDQIHLTMSFLGEVDGAREERLRETLATVKVHAAFFLPVAGVGVFGGDRPKVVWAGVGKGHPHLYALHQHLQDAVLHAELEPDLKPFHPHITVARLRDVSRATLKPFLRRYYEAEFGLWKVTGFTLFSSVLAPGGSSYTAEMRQDFQACA